jgi:hypothetical protein
MQEPVFIPFTIELMIYRHVIRVRIVLAFAAVKTSVAADPVPPGSRFQLRFLCFVFPPSFLRMHMELSSSGFLLIRGNSTVR